MKNIANRVTIFFPGSGSVLMICNRLCREKEVIGVQTSDFFLVGKRNRGSVVLHTLVCKDSNTGEPKSSSMTTRLRCATNSLRSLIQKVRKGTGIRIYISAVYIVSVEGNVDVAEETSR